MIFLWRCGAISRHISGFSIEITGDQDKMWIKIRYICLRSMIQLKLVDEISLNFPELFITGKYVKIGFRNRGSPCYFLSSRGQKIKNITKIEQKRLFLFTFLVSFETDLDNKYMIKLCVWLIFWTRSSIKLIYFRGLCKKMT